MDTQPFGFPKKTWMINFRTGNLERLEAQLCAAVMGVDVDPMVYSNGRFARLHDPERNPIELWARASGDAPKAS